jgi:hypothetical protein
VSDKAKKRDVTDIQRETDNVVFFEPRCLSLGKLRDPTDSTSGYDSSPGGWYSYGDRRGKPEGRTLVVDRWIYLFVRSGSSAAGYRLLHEYYVDKDGLYWRSDHKDLFEGAWTEQRFKPAKHREDALRAKASGAADPYIRIPFSVADEKWSSVTVAMAYPMPAHAIENFRALAEEMLPIAVVWEGNRPVVAYSGTVREESDGPGGKTPPVYALTTVDPLELAVRTGAAYRAAVDDFSERYKKRPTASFSHARSITIARATPRPRRRPMSTSGAG